MVNFFLHRKKLKRRTTTSSALRILGVYGRSLAPPLRWNYFVIFIFTATVLLAANISAPRPLAPPSTAHRFNQALALWHAGRPDAAAAELRQLADALPYETAFALGVIEARRGDVEAARAAFARALRARENDPAALHNLAWCNGRLHAGTPGTGENPVQGVITLTPEQARRLLATASPSRRNRLERPQEARW